MLRKAGWLGATVVMAAGVLVAAGWVHAAPGEKKDEPAKKPADQKPQTK